jgi:hypothetical protein
VLDLLLVYADTVARRRPGALDLSELRLRLEGHSTLAEQCDAIEAALDALALL